MSIIINKKNQMVFMLFNKYHNVDKMWLIFKHRVKFFTCCATKNQRKYDQLPQISRKHFFTRNLVIDRHTANVYY